LCGVFHAIEKSLTTADPPPLFFQGFFHALRTTIARFSQHNARSSEDLRYIEDEWQTRSPPKKNQYRIRKRLTRVSPRMVLAKMSRSFSAAVISFSQAKNRSPAGLASALP
jgi:hypothetical protein